uniref:tetratricopeptide repeat-containing sulfotransferase family protein n=1 Tax=Pararhizobium sp. IMCC3301 TaxID=3067904 RepID=UPI0027419443|nr:tetratricopeptide repeat-containing sulfotransferase family protein [Pararhizobium sp. IMCC3301]
MNRAEKRRLARQTQANQASAVSLAPARKKKRGGVYRTKGDPQQLMAMLEQAHKLYTGGQPEQAKLAYHAILQIDENFPDANNSLGIIDVEAGNHGLAARWFRKAIKAEPTRPTFHNNCGLALLELEKAKEAVACFEASLKADPDFVPAMVNLGKGYNLIMQFALAVPVLEKAISITPDFLEAYVEMALAHGELGALDKAVAALDTALETQPNHGRLLNQKANLLITFGKIDDAEAIFREILNRSPNNVGAYTSIARSKKFESYDDDLANMERLYKTIPDVDYAKILQGEQEKDGHEDPKMNLAMALAKAFEAIKDFEQSFFYYKEGNRLKRKKFFYNQADDFRQFDMRMKLFTPALISEFKGGFADKTPIFIVGMPRSGTTLLEQVFHAHRDVFGAGELGFMPQAVRARFKDMQTFEDKLKAGKVTQETFREIGAAYIEKIREIDSDSPFITDKMPHNFVQVGFIKLALPEAKVIHSYRNPIDNAFAIFKQIFGNEGHQYGYDLVELGQYHNKYRELMAHWNSLFPGEILENRYEDMVANLESQTRKVLDFCGLEWDPNCLNFHEAERAVRTASVTQVRQPIYKGSVEKWRKYETQLQPLIRVLEKGLPF